MAQDTSDPVDRITTVEIGSHLEETEMSFSLTAAREARAEYGGLHLTSREGETVSGRERVLGVGAHTIDLSSVGGHVDFSVDAGDERVVSFSTDDEGAAGYRWSFTANQNWSGGSINEGATEIAQMEVEGKTLPSHAASGEQPDDDEPAMDSTITRPQAPTKEDTMPGLSTPRKAENPVKDDK